VNLAEMRERRTQTQAGDEIVFDSSKDDLDALSLTW
jgi:hypothetical protein